MKHSAMIKRLVMIFILVIGVLSLTGCASESDSWPLNGFTDETNLLGWIFIYPIGWLMSTIGNLFNGSYGFAIIFTTIIIRFAAWPIYAGQTNMSFNMQTAQPDIEKLNAKYAGRTDQASSMAKSQELREIYKKHNVSFKSCLSLPIQMGLFTGMTRAMTRIVIPDGLLTLDNFKIFGFDLRGSLWSDEYGVGNMIFTGVLVALVALTSFGQQYYIKKRNENLRKSENITKKVVNPDAPAALDPNKMMKMMLILMPISLAFMAAGNTAYALYWTIGNTCSFITMFVNYKLQQKRRAKLDAQKENTVEIL